MPHEEGHDTRNVVFNAMPEVKDIEDSEFMARWDKIIAAREDAKKALEIARSEKTIGASLDAAVTLYANGETYDFLKSVEAMLKPVFIVSSVSVVNGEGGSFKGETVGVDVTRAGGQKCERCWSYSETVGSDPEHPTLCARCAAVIKEMGIEEN